MVDQSRVVCIKKSVQIHFALKTKIQDYLFSINVLTKVFTLEATCSVSIEGGLSLVYYWELIFILSQSFGLVIQFCITCSNMISLQQLGMGYSPNCWNNKLALKAML